MSYNVRVLPQVRDWMEHVLEEPQRIAVLARLALLEDEGPALGTPYVGKIKGSIHDPQMKAIRCSSGGRHLRVLFMFDPHRRAILLYGGDKTGQFTTWYRTAIREADSAYTEYLKHHTEEDE